MWLKIKRAGKQFDEVLMYMLQTLALFGFMFAIWVAIVGVYILAGGKV